MRKRRSSSDFAKPNRVPSGMRLASLVLRDRSSIMRGLLDNLRRVGDEAGGSQQSSK